MKTLSKTKKQKIYLHKDYYGNQDFGKRAYWFKDADGNEVWFKGGNFMFVRDAEDVMRSYLDIQFIIKD